MKLHIISCIATLLGCLSFSSPRADTGNELYHRCQEPDTANKGLCNGYIIGAWEALDAYLLTDKLRICARTHVTKGQIIAVTLKWIEQHPELRDVNASLIVGRAMSDAFPCQ